MTKLEELSELLVSEIEQFEKTVEKLQKIQQQKILIDSRSLESAIKTQQGNLEKVLFSHKEDMKSLSYSLKKARVYPAWALTMFVTSIILNGIFIYKFLSGIF